MENKFSKEIRADEDAYYMSCPEMVSKHLAQNLIGIKSAVELCCAVGLTCIQLAKVIPQVIGVDINEKRLIDAKYNSRLYQIENIKFIHGDVLDESLIRSIKADVAILDPDWSPIGNDKDNHTNNIDNTQPSMRKLFEYTSKYITKNIVIRIPKTFEFDNLRELGLCKIENIIWNGKIKFKFAYFSPEITENSEKDIIFD